MKETVTPHSVANTVRLIRTQRKQCVIITEGDTDARVLKRFIDPISCRIEIGHGKDNVLGAMEILQQAKVDGILSIVDKDCFLVSASNSGPNVLVTDSHDLETMMFQTNAFEKVLSELGSEDKIKQHAREKGKHVLNVLLEASLPIGFLRLASQQNGLNLKFEGCDYGSFIEKDNLTIDVTKLVRNIVNKTQNHSLDQTGMLSMIEVEARRGLNPWDVACGHDLSNILALGLRKALGSCNAHSINGFSLEASLRLAYEDSYFRMTQLYRSMQEWQRRNAPYVVLK